MMEVNLGNFQLLHSHLLSILSTNNHEGEHLPEKVMQYIGMIVESEKHDAIREDFFDFFCENNGNKILSLTLEVDPLLAVKVLSMLFINLRTPMWVSYLLCQPFVTGSIAHDETPPEEEWAEYFISLLKSLSIRLNCEHLSLFYNKKFCKFPLLYEAIKYYNHSDCMVRTNVMNIVLGVMKIKDPRLSQYFASFPFTSYILTYCCQIFHRIRAFHAHLLDQASAASPRSFKANLRSLIRMYFIDLSDYLCYLNDLMESGPLHLSYFIENAILSYIVLPVLKSLQESPPPLVVRGIIYLLYTVLKTINSERFQETVCLLVLGREVPKEVVERMSMKDCGVHIPQVYRQEFSPNEYYWDKYEYQIEECCLEVFKDISNFDTPHSLKEPCPKLASEFQQQLHQISLCLGYDILTKELMPGSFPLSQLPNMLGFDSESPWPTPASKQLEKNPLRQLILQELEDSVADPSSSNHILCITTLLIYLTKCEGIRNQILKFCGLLLPRLDTVNYQDDFNISSLRNIQRLAIDFLRALNAHQEPATSEERLPRGFPRGPLEGPPAGGLAGEGGDRSAVYCVGSVRNMLILLDGTTYKPLAEEEEVVFQGSYRRALENMKNLVCARNLKQVCENFEFDYTKWTKVALVPDAVLPYSIFIDDGKIDPSEVELHFLGHLSSQREHVQYCIRNLAIVQHCYFRHCEVFGKELTGLQIYTEKYNKLYSDKFLKVEEQWKVGQSYEIGYRHMMECMSQENKTKNCLKYLLVEDACNLVVVQPSNEENTARIVINHPWKYVMAELDRQNGRKMVVKITKCVKGDAALTLFFENEMRTASTLEWINQLKYQRYQSEQAFILSYLKDCLSKQ